MTSDIAKLDADAAVGLDPTVVPVVVSADEVHLRAGPWAGPIVTLQDESRDGKLARVIEEFDAGASIADVVATVEGVEERAVRAVLAELDAKNLVFRADADTDGDAHTDADADTDADTERDRSPLPLRFAADDLDALAATSVLVVSSGRIGPEVAEGLHRAGVGEIRVRHREDDGTDGEFSGADEVAAWAADDSSLADAVEAADLVVAATQRPWCAAAERANELAVEAGTPLAVAEVTGYDVMVGPTVLPGETACYECYRHRRNANVGSAGDYPAFERTACGRRGGVGDLLPLAEIAAGLLVTDAVNVLCYGHGYTVGSVLTFDMSDLSTASNDVLRVPRCETCSRVADSVGRDSLVAPKDLVER
jgi:bacteriocin biosynthesis cyclodehydratase domain-containing protein